MNFRDFFVSMIVLGVSLEATQTGDSSAFSLLVEGEFYSQTEQDKFAYSILYGLLDKQDQGYYLEIGAGEPIAINNSYFFEKNLQWSGVSIDIYEGFKQNWATDRKNPLLCADATQVDYTAILNTFPHTIDYLSLDIDALYDVVLEKLAYSNHVFKVITIEHDFYRYGDLYRQREREILKGLGYYLLCPDVLNTGHSFEDWWIYPDCFPADLFSRLTSLDLQARDGKEIVKTIQTLIHDSDSMDTRKLRPSGQG